jgi:hypothetical protein
MSDDKIEEIRTRHDAGPRGLLPIPALAEALDDLATALAEIEKLRADYERLTLQLDKAWAEIEAAGLAVVEREDGR